MLKSYPGWVLGHRNKCDHGHRDNSFGGGNHDEDGSEFCRSREPTGI
jgi:hypothetical protein